MRGYKSRGLRIRRVHSWDNASGGTRRKTCRNHAVCGARVGHGISRRRSPHVPGRPEAQPRDRCGLSPWRGPHPRVEVPTASLLYSLPRVGKVTPYVAGGVGLSHYGEPVFSSSSSSEPPIGTRRRLAVTVNTGAGLKVPINERLVWRTDARWFNALGQGSEGFAWLRASPSVSANGRSAFRAAGSGS